MDCLCPAVSTVRPRPLRPAGGRLRGGVPHRRRPVQKRRRGGGEKGRPQGGEKSGGAPYRQRRAGQDAQRRAAGRRRDEAAGRQHRRPRRLRRHRAAGAGVGKDLRGGEGPAGKTAPDPQVYGLLPAHHVEAPERLRPHERHRRLRGEHRRHAYQGGGHDAQHRGRL